MPLSSDHFKKIVKISESEGNEALFGSRIFFFLQKIIRPEESSGLFYYEFAYYRNDISSNECTLLLTLRSTVRCTSNKAVGTGDHISTVCIPQNPSLDTNTFNRNNYYQFN